MGLGSARASRAGDGALAIANFSDCAQAPTLQSANGSAARARQTARETRAFPGIIAIRLVYSGLPVAAPIWMRKSESLPDPAPRQWESGGMTKTKA
jgi:hypothetical protein